MDLTLWQLEALRVEQLRHACELEALNDQIGHTDAAHKQLLKDLRKERNRLEETLESMDDTQIDIMAAVCRQEQAIAALEQRVDRVEDIQVGGKRGEGGGMQSAPRHAPYRYPGDNIDVTESDMHATSPSRLRYAMP